MKNVAKNIAKTSLTSTTPAAQAPKQVLDTHLDAVLALLNSKACPESLAAVRSLLNLHRAPVERSLEGLTFAVDSVAPHTVEMSEASAEFVMTELVDKYTVADPSQIQKAIREQMVSFNSRQDRVRFGQYYTPVDVVALMKEMADPILEQAPKATVILDPAAGQRDLLIPFPGYRCIAADIDPVTHALNTELGIADSLCGNSLDGANRAKFNVADSDHLVMLMNPPFNNMSSMHHREDKTGQVHACDEHLKARDLGVSFLRLAAHLQADAIVAIHPWSLIGKETNFKGMGDFPKHYKLTQAAVFSSSAFGLKGQEFAVMVGVYLPGSMTYADIRQREFPIYRSTPGGLIHAGEFLQIAKAHPKTHKPIRGGMPTKDMRQDSELGVYYYNFRDNNNVCSTANFTSKPSSSAIPVQWTDLGHYAYINCLKRYLPNDFVVGNLNPLVRETDLLDAEFMDTCIYDAILCNQGIAAFTRTNKTSFVVSKHMLLSAKTKALAFKGQGVNPHQAFVDFWTKGKKPDALAPVLKAYFTKLKSDAIVVKKTAVGTVMVSSKGFKAGTAIKVAQNDAMARLAISVVKQAMGLVVS